MGKTKNKKESPVLNDYPNGIPIAPKFPTTKEEIIQVQKANMDYLCSMAKYDTLRSATIIIDDYGAIPVYALEFEYL